MTKLPILILPGTLCTGKMFEHQINTLKEHCDNVTVVQFTTENTLAKMAEKVAQAADHTPCAIIGFSMGGIVALELAKKQPNLIAKLALINSNSHGDLPERKHARQGQIDFVKAGNLSEFVANTLMPNYLYKPNAQHESLILTMAQTLGPECFVAQVKAIEDRADSLSTLAKLAADIVIIGGENDSVCPAEHQILMHNSVKNSQLTLLKECAHFAPLEQAEAVSNTLLNWYLYQSH